VFSSKNFAGTSQGLPRTSPSAPAMDRATWLWDSPSSSSQASSSASPPFPLAKCELALNHSPGFRLVRPVLLPGLLFVLSVWDPVPFDPSPLSECADCYAVCLQNKQHEWECLQEERPYNCLNAYKDCLVMCVSLRCFCPSLYLQF
jgi:hypothetical protein